MRVIYPLVAAACLLAAPCAWAAQCGGAVRVDLSTQRPAAGDSSGFISTGAQLARAVEGTYALSNGRRLALIDIDQQVYADFDKSSRVRLEEVGPHRFASREGDIELTWVPGERTDTIQLSYPADSRGRFRRGCS